MMPTLNSPFAAASDLKKVSHRWLCGCRLPAGIDKTQFVALNHDIAIGWRDVDDVGEWGDIVGYVHDPQRYVATNDFSQHALVLRCHVLSNDVCGGNLCWQVPNQATKCLQSSGRRAYSNPELGDRRSGFLFLGRSVQVFDSHQIL
jgi:hypothetical protein